VVRVIDEPNLGASGVTLVSVTSVPTAARVLDSHRAYGRTELRESRLRRAARVATTRAVAAALTLTGLLIIDIAVFYGLADRCRYEIPLDRSTSAFLASAIRQAVAITLSLWQNGSKEFPNSLGVFTRRTLVFVVVASVVMDGVALSGALTLPKCRFDWQQSWHVNGTPPYHGGRWWPGW